ncbi:MAG: sigma-E processing peptidase SpoIIGA [Oscillospiraceae bacterium]|nr:sigma-E processing peptidase SpoIIGA [Oscillospiraceae bacterium]MBQ9837998.1 sigma-E processing peptidase SpoIIGA [Oscillospiraceae bacterium]
MENYLGLVMMLYFGVELLLLVGASCLAGMRPEPGRTVLAASVGAVYTAACLLPGAAALGSLPGRAVQLLAVSLIAYGCSRDTLRRGVLYLLLSMALGGFAMGLGGGMVKWLLAAAGIFALCLLAFQGCAGKRYIGVELSRGGNTVSLNALVDSGNMLKDPVTGEQVLVVGAEAANKLTGLTPAQLSQPLQTVVSAAVPGLRLIPYRAVGKATGMLLGMKIEDARVGRRRCGTVVAFAPEGLEDRGFQALIGGIV